MEKYDVFISYRHLPLDKAVASRLQVLLENSRLCKRERPLCIFRDQSELRTSNDLGRNIQDALLQSRYLIVVCSEQTKDSFWCKQEIRLFKEAHHGSTENILTLVVSGEPNEVLPEELLFEGIAAPQPEEGNEVQKVKVEPLCADVRANSIRKSLKKLKVEFLRLAAPILGCGFDDLYQRRQRRRRRNAAIAAGSAITVLTAVLAVVSVAAYRTWISENRYKGILADSYAQEASRYAASGKPQEALLYYTQALALKPEQSSSTIGAALLMQEYAWPILEEEAAGRILGKDFLPVEYAYAGDPEKDIYLCGGRDGLHMVNGDGKKLGSLPQKYENFLSVFSDWWVFCDEQDIFLYHPESKQEYTIPMPQESSLIYEEQDLLYELLPAVIALDGDRVVVAYKGIVHLYSLNGQGGAEEIVQTDLSMAYPNKTDLQTISFEHNIYPSQDGSLALVSSDALVALYDMEKLTLKAGVQRYIDYTSGMDISSDNKYFALSYGTDYQDGISNPGGYFEIYSQNGELLFCSEHYSKEALLGIAFHPDQSEYLVAWSASYVHVWNWKEEKEIAAPVSEENIRAACITREGMLLVDNNDNTVSFYTLQKPLTDKNITAEPDGQGNDEKFVTYYPHLEKFEEVGKLDCGNEAILRVCFGDVWTATELQSKDILLFGKNGQRLARITPEHDGNVVKLLTDSDFRYVVLILEETIAQADSYHFNKNSVLEIWDLSSELMLSSLEWENRTVSSAYITEDGKLCWSIRDVSDSLCLTVPFLDEEAMRFLCGLSCLSLDEKQDIICKKSYLSGNQMGSWGVFLSGWQKEQMQTEITKDGTDDIHYELPDMVSELNKAEDYAKDTWFQRCDALWKSLLEGEIPCRTIDFDSFYSCYIQAAAHQGLPEKIAPGLEAYLELQLKIWDEEDSSVTVMDTLLSETLVFTTMYDEQIIRFLKEVCSILEESEVSIPEDADDVTRMQMELEANSQEAILVMFRSWIGALEGNTQTLLFEFPDGSMEESFYKYFYKEMQTLGQLAVGDTQRAKELSNEWISYMLQLDDDGSAMGEMLKTHLEWADILMTRGMVEKAVLDEYLSSINLSVFGLKIMEVSPALQEEGMRLDDLIVSINGQRVVDLYQYFRVKQEEGLHTAEVLRNGEMISITLQEAAAFGGKMVYEANKSIN